MKKKLLLLSVILASQVSFGQLTQANEPAAGTASTMYTVTDTAGVTLAGVLSVVGENVEWDYSTVVMETSASGAVTVGNAATAPHASTFPTSTKTITQGTIIQYFNSSSTQRVAQGFVFNDPTFGEVIVPFNSDPAVLLTYPFGYGVVSNDTYSGNTTLTIPGIPFPIAATINGKINSTVDGTGTLKLPGGTNIANVFRVTTKDTTEVDASLAIEVIRTQLEYYDLNDQNLPIFVDAYISISGLGEQRQVLSKNYAEVGLDKNAIQNLVLYPNPSNGEFTISGEFAKGNVEVTDLTGKVVYTSEVMSGATIKLNDIKSGMYTVKLSAGEKASVQKITIK